MIEKVNPSHPDKMADRIAGAIVDLAYKKQEKPKIAVEVLIGHGYGHVVIETSVDMEEKMLHISWSELLQAFGCLFKSCHRMCIWRKISPRE